VAAGAYPNVPRAATAMGKVVRDAYVPDLGRHAAYTELYREYVRLHDYLGGSEQAGGNEVLHRLRDRRNAVSADAVPA
jgi:L-ribulokinase